MTENHQNTGLLLDILGNETRRRIFQLLADEPRYLLQLAKELDISQQAVLKHLTILEEHGFITSFEKESDLAAPPRKYYELAKSMFISIDLMCDSMGIMFHEISENDMAQGELMPSDLQELEKQLEELESTTDARQMLTRADVFIREIDNRIKELQKMEIYLLQMKQATLKKVHKVIREVSENPLERKILYRLIGSSIPDANVEVISEELNVREKEVAQTLRILQRKLSYPKKIKH